jgi:pilus assembly protein CpaF
MMNFSYLKGYNCDKCVCGIYWKKLARKKGITEVIINRPDNIFVEHQGELVKLNTKLNAGDIESFIQEVARQNHKTFGPDHPIMDGSLPDGSRINVIGNEYALGGPAITIRRYLKSITSFDESPGIFGLNPRWIDFLRATVKGQV